MVRPPRVIFPGYCYHFLNRGNRQATLFHEARDYEAFLALLREADQRVPMPVMAVCLMPNHVHLVVRPASAHELQRWAHWLFTKHATHYHAKYGTNGHVWQGRYKTIAVQTDEHLLILMRYVERNAYRKKLVASPEDWIWGSLHWRCTSKFPIALAESPVPLPKDWSAFVREPRSANELAEIRQSIAKRRPFGNQQWVAERLAESGGNPNPVGRPRKTRK